MKDQHKHARSIGSTTSSYDAGQVGGDGRRPAGPERCAALRPRPPQVKQLSTPFRSALLHAPTTISRRRRLRRATAIQCDCAVYARHAVKSSSAPYRRLSHICMNGRDKRAASAAALRASAPPVSIFSYSALNLRTGVCVVNSLWSFNFPSRSRGR